MTDNQNDDSVNKLVKEVAEYTLKHINNLSDYEIVKISFIRLRWDNGTIEEKKNIYLTIPELYVAEF